MCLSVNSFPDKLHGADITLAIGCKLNCRYCPQQKMIEKYIGKFGNEQFIMSFDTFKKCLSKFVPGTGVGIAGMGEPFHNPDCAKMIRYAYDNGIQINLSTTLVGMKLEDWELIKDIEYKKFVLHIPDEENNSKFLLTDEYLAALKLVCDSGKVSAYSCHGSIKQKIEGYLDNSIPLYSEMMDRAGNLDFQDLEKHFHTGPIHCNEDGGWVPEILPNGTLLICCMDYGMRHVLGNLLTQSWNDIVQSLQFLKVEQGKINEEQPILCRTCPHAVKCVQEFNICDLMAGNAIAVARKMEQIKKVGIDNSKNKANIIINKLLSAENICIFGLGKLFQENYFVCGWNKVIKANYLSDNDSQKWNTCINGLPVISPEEILALDNCLIVIYVKNQNEIIEQLNVQSIENVVSIYDIYTCLK